MNKIILIGRLTRDPEIRYTKSNRAVTQFTIAIDRPFVKEDGTKETDFINIIAWDSLGENIGKYMTKGKLVAVEGRLQTRNYENNEGKKVYVSEVVANNVQFLESKKNNSVDNIPAPPLENKTSYKPEEIDNIPYENDPFTSNINISDSDLPF